MKTRTYALALAPLLAASVAHATPQQDCAKLEGLKIAPAAIGLPTSGAGVTSARLVPAAILQDTPVPQHCFVSGVIRPVDPKAPNIEFAVALPTAWNSRAVMLGGGGFSGNVPRLTGRLGTPVGNPTPLARGYTVFGGDSGHRNKAVEPGDFMLNKEAYDNYTGDALKKTRDAATVVIKAAYGRTPARAYFWGGSTGGREALLVAGRWPQDWDGVVSRFPALHLITSVLGGHNMVRTHAEPGTWLNPAERGVLYRAAVAACDGLDGARDGVITNVRGCDAAFDPTTATLNGAPIRCPDGADRGDACLSDVQLRALVRIKNGITFKFPLASGDTGHPGYNVYTADHGVGTQTSIERAISNVAFGSRPPAFPAAEGMSLKTTYGDNFFRYSVGKGQLSFNSLTMDPTDPGPEAAALLSAMSARDAADTDLSRFAARGGKLLLVQGLADTVISPKMTEQYYRILQKRMGPEKVAAFSRYYEIAGWNHGMSMTFNAAWDDLAALESWAERGVDPGETEIVYDMTGVPGRSRPICLFPRWPKYDGQGDMNLASSFTCSTE
jgi:feruloyl esterase